MKPARAGTYKCEAFNSEGWPKTNGLLTVNTPSQFIKKQAMKSQLIPVRKVLFKNINDLLQTFFELYQILIKNL